MFMTEPFKVELAPHFQYALPDYLEVPLVTLREDLELFARGYDGVVVSPGDFADVSGSKGARTLKAAFDSEDGRKASLEIYIPETVDSCGDPLVSLETDIERQLDKGVLLATHGSFGLNYEIEPVEEDKGRISVNALYSKVVERRERASEHAYYGSLQAQQKELTAIPFTEISQRLLWALGSFQKIVDPPKKR